MPRLQSGRISLASLVAAIGLFSGSSLAQAPVTEPVVKAALLALFGSESSPPFTIKLDWRASDANVRDEQTVTAARQIDRCSAEITSVWHRTNRKDDTTIFKNDVIYRMDFSKISEIYASFGKLDLEFSRDDARNILYVWTVGKSVVCLKENTPDFKCTDRFDRRLDLPKSAAAAIKAKLDGFQSQSKCYVPPPPIVAVVPPPRPPVPPQPAPTKEPVKQSSVFAVFGSKGPTAEAALDAVVVKGDFNLSAKYKYTNFNLNECKEAVGMPGYMCDMSWTYNGQFPKSATGRFVLRGDTWALVDIQ